METLNNAFKTARILVLNAILEDSKDPYFYHWSDMDRVGEHLIEVMDEDGVEFSYHIHRSHADIIGGSDDRGTVEVYCESSLDSIDIYDLNLVKDGECLELEPSQYESLCRLMSLYFSNEISIRELTKSLS